MSNFYWQEKQLQNNRFCPPCVPQNPCVPPINPPCPPPVNPPCPPPVNSPCPQAIALLSSANQLSAQLVAFENQYFALQQQQPEAQENLDTLIAQVNDLVSKLNASLEVETTTEALQQDIVTFLNTLTATPEAVILATPMMPASMPNIVVPPELSCEQQVNYLTDKITTIAAQIKALQNSITVAENKVLVIDAALNALKATYQQVLNELGNLPTATTYPTIDDFKQAEYTLLSDLNNAIKQAGGTPTITLPTEDDTNTGNNGNTTVNDPNATNSQVTQLPQ